MDWLLEHCELVLTGSGGVQKEAFFFGKVCVTMLDQTDMDKLYGGGEASQRIVDTLVKDEPI